jgi:hypothetical protein
MRGHIIEPEEMEKLRELEARARNMKPAALAALASAGRKQVGGGGEREAETALDREGMLLSIFEELDDDGSGYVSFNECVGEVGEVGEVGGHLTPRAIGSVSC